MRRTLLASALPIASLFCLRAGPTPDGRVKPDVVAPGTVTSAKVGYGSADDCELQTMAVSGGAEWGW